MRKKLIVLCLLIFSFLSVQTVSAADVDICSAAINARTGGFVGGKNQDKVLPLASLTKLMTALVLADLRINFNKKVVITRAEVDYTRPFVSRGDVTSSIDLRPGDEVTKRDLWRAMLIASSNEAAVALVDRSGLSRAGFVKRMNRKARALGLKHTVFTEPSGIDPQNKSTAKEMAVIAKRAFANYYIRQASVMKAYAFKELKTGRRVRIYSRNRSLLAMKPLGMKVGYLTEARDNCAVRLRKGGKDRIVVILHAANTVKRNIEIDRLMKR